MVFTQPLHHEALARPQCSDFTTDFQKMFFCTLLWISPLTAFVKSIALDGFDLNTVHRLSNKEEKSQLSWDSNPGCWVVSKNATSVLPEKY